MEASSCKTDDDIIKFLVSHMIWNPDPPAQRDWVQQFGFRHYYWIQQVWFNPATGQYAFHSDEFDSWDADTTPNLGMYNSFHEMLQGVAETYQRRWNSSVNGVPCSSSSAAELNEP